MPPSASVRTGTGAERDRSEGHGAHGIRRAMRSRRVSILAILRSSVTAHSSSPAPARPSASSPRTTASTPPLRGSMRETEKSGLMAAHRAAGECDVLEARLETTSPERGRRVVPRSTPVSGSSCVSAVAVSPANCARPTVPPLPTQTGAEPQRHIGR